MKSGTIILLALIAAVMAGCGHDSVEKLRAEGKDYYKNGNFKKARQCFVDGLAQDPADQDLLFYAGLAYEKDYMFDSAMYYFKRADIMKPKNREINEEIYKLAKQLADYPNVISSIDVLAETGDGYDKYLEELAFTYDKDSKPGQAYYWARKATVRGTNDPEIYFMAAGRAADYDSMAVAMQLLDSAMTKFPEDPRFPGTKGLLLYYQGKLPEAEMTLRPLAEKSPPGMPTYKFSLARVLASEKDRDKKTEALSILQAIRPAILPETGIDSIITSLQKQLGK